MKLIYIFLLLFCFSATESFGQVFVNQGCYWPDKSPNLVVRSTKDSTSEDWWYDFKTVPSGHVAYDTGGRYICVGYSNFDDIGVSTVYTTEQCSTHLYNEINFNAALDPSNFDLPDMRHMGNASGTIGLVNLTRTSSSANPLVWTYHYGKGTAFFKVIPTNDGGFLATGYSNRFNIPYITSGTQVEPQFSDFLSNNPPVGGNPSLIHYQSPSPTTGFPNTKYPFTFANCPPFGTDPVAGGYKNHACLAKVDADGILQWFYTYGIVPHDGINGDIAYMNSTMGKDLVENDSGYVVAGILQNSPVNGNFANRPFLLQVDVNGDLKWIREYRDTTYKSEKFTGIKLKSATEVYVIGERTYDIGTFCSPPTYSPISSNCINFANNAILEHHRSMRFLGFLKKINISTGSEIWDLALTTNPSVGGKVRSFDIDSNDKILVGVSDQCSVAGGYAPGECKVSYVNKITDLGTSATIYKTISFGPMRAFDLNTSLGVKATDDGGFAVVGTKKAYNLDINKRYDLSPFGSGYNMTAFAQAFAQTDTYVAKCNSAGDIEWANIFDNKVAAGNGSILSTAGNPRDQTNLDNWMNYTTTRSKKDIKRQECLYAIATSTTGEIIVGGNMSSNIDDGYLAMADNTCDLTLSNYLIQSITSFEHPGVTPVPITNMNNFIGSNISTGRVPGNTNDVAEFIVNKGAVIKMEAGEDITMYEGTDLNVDLDALADIDAYINSSHTCTSGPVYAYNSYTPSFSRSPIVKDKKTFLPANIKPQIIASPNPTTGLVTIKHPTAINQFEVFDLYGKTIFKIRTNGSGQTKVDFTNVPAGIYLLRMENVTESIKIVKQ